MKDNFVRATEDHSTEKVIVKNNKINENNTNDIYSSNDG